jgi:hypothetical protein
MNRRQIQTDEILRRQVSIVDGVISIITSDNKLRTIGYHFKEKEGKVIGFHKQMERVLTINEANAKLFFPQKMENQSFAKS